MLIQGNLYGPEFFFRFVSENKQLKKQKGNSGGFCSCGEIDAGDDGKPLSVVNKTPTSSENIRLIRNDGFYFLQSPVRC